MLKVTSLVTPVVHKPLRLVRLSLLAVTCCLFFTKTGAQNPSSSTRFEEPLIVACSQDGYPQSFVGPDGRPAGFSADILDAIAKSMGLKITRIVGPGGDLIKRFEKGEFDMLQILSKGPGRENFAEFTVPYLDLQGSFFVRKNDNRYENMSDLGGAVLAIPGHNNICEQYLNDQRLSVRITYTTSIEDSLKGLSAGKFDAAFSSRLTAVSLIDLHKIKNLRPLGNPLVGYDLRQCFAVHRGDAALLARLNEGLAILHRTGEYEKIYHRWFGRHNTPVFTRLELLSYLAVVLATAWGLATWGFMRQRRLRKRIAKQAEALADSEAILAEAQQIARLGHWVYRNDTHTLVCSAETLRIMERDPARGPPSYLRVLSIISRSERSVANRTIREAHRTGTSCDLSLTIHPRPNVHKNVHATVRPLRDSEGRIIGIFGTIQDITRRKSAEENLRAREQLLSAIYKSVPNAMGVIEEAGESFRIISANPGTALLLGLKDEILNGRLLSELPLSPALLAFWTSSLKTSAQKADITRSQYHLDGLRRHYAVTLVPLSLSSGGRAQYCFLIEDITDRKQMDEEIAQGRKLRAVGELVGGIAHEFNNLLTPIILKTDLLIHECRQNRHILQELDTVMSAARRGADLTKRLLAFGRRSENRLEEIQLRALIEANFDLLRPTIDRRIKLEAEVPDKTPAIVVNTSDLHQIVINLLLNARDTLVDKLDRNPLDTWSPRILVKVSVHEANALLLAGPVPQDRKPTGWICLGVQDNGLGMHQDVLERIFEPFYTTKEVGKGTGLGLATVWHLATRLGGRINVQSSLGEGSTFNVWIPILPVAPKAETFANEPAKQTIKGTILLVEDDELVAKTVTSVLQRHEHRVTHFAHGAEAWRHLNANRDYDLLLLDLDLPGINGLEIARRARSAPFNGKILVASGRLTEAELREFAELKIDGKLEKPFNPQVLLQSIQACLRGESVLPPPPANSEGTSTPWTSPGF